MDSRSKIKRCLPFDLVTTFKGDTFRLGMPLHNSICAEKVKNGRCDKIAAGQCLFVILLEKRWCWAWEKGPK